jgi:cell division initiation protein
MYKAHLEMISSMPESYEEDDTTETAEDIANAVANSVNE